MFKRSAILALLVSTFFACGGQAPPAVWNGGDPASSLGESSSDLKSSDSLNNRTFVTIGSMLSPRDLHTATVLPDGRVLLAGGRDGFGVLSSAELFNPRTGTFAATGSMSAARYGHRATLLPNGRVLITGGQGSGLLASAELYDPATGTFTPTGPMSEGRFGHSATALSTGKVLIAGGAGPTSSLATAELYDYRTGTFTNTGSMAGARQDHTATVLPNGQVLIAGGAEGFEQRLSSAELYNPRTGTFTATGSMAFPRSFHTATLLSNGTVLIAGGFAFGAHPGELYDSRRGTFSLTSSMTAAGEGHAATLLSGQVVITGGFGVFNSYLGTGVVRTTETYRNGAFTSGPPMNRARTFHTATLLGNGSILIAGGVGGTSTLASAELFQTATTACVSGVAGCGWRDGDVVTFSQFAWGDTTTASGLLNTNFGVVYPLGFLQVGLPDLRLLFTEPDALFQFLPTSGTPGPLTQSFVDPTDPTNGGAGSFSGEVIALQLNVDFADADLTLGTSRRRLGDLTMCGFDTLPDLNGLEVRDFLALVNTALGGGSTVDSITDLNQVTRELNSSFTFGYVQPFAQEHLFNGPCP